MRTPTPFTRSWPFFQSSWPTQNFVFPARISAPINFPAFSHLSPIVKPSTSRYHARLLSTSLTVKLGDEVVSTSPASAARFGAAFLAEVLRARVRAVFFGVFRLAAMATSLWHTGADALRDA